MTGETNSPKLAKQLNKHGNKRGMHPNSLKNLEKRVSWKPGQSGNPGGHYITQRQQKMMSEACPFDGRGRTWLEALAEGGMRQALTIPVALSNLQDRHEGKVTLPIGGEGGEPIIHKIIVASEHDKQNIKRVLNGERTY